MINSQDKDRISTQPFSTSSMDLFASSQGLDIEQRKREKKKNRELLSSYEIYLDVAEDHVNEGSSKNKQTIEEEQKKSKLQEFDESEVHAHSDQEQRQKRKKKRPRSQDMDICDVHVSRDLGNSMLQISSDSKAHTNVPEDSSACKEQRKDKYKLKGLNKNELCADSEQEQRHAVKKKTRKHKSIDMDVCDVNVSGDFDDDQNGGVEVYPSRNEICADGKKGHSEAESKCASDDVHNGDENTITWSECSNSGKGKEKKRKSKSEVNILSENKSHFKYQESCTNQISQHDELCLTENNEEIHRSEQVNPLSVCESLDMTHNEEAAKCKIKKTRKLNKHTEEIKFLNECQGFDKNHQCYLCEVSVAGKNNYIKHLATAHDKHVFQCSQCGRCCTSQEGLSLHQSSVCDQERNLFARVYKCKDCPMSYKSNRSLGRHRREQHNIGGTVREHVCHLCNKSFTRQASLRIHYLTCMKRKENSVEEGQVEVSCEECQKVFSSRRSLKYHISTIHEQRLFECSTCGEVFRWSKSLSKHRQKCQ
ncbi:zinc finger protein 37-like isoform X2 [Pomacea canaliculata]|nr:zinc finger protein 37-like isoform X2 [Pomacea canaliculata]